MHVPCDVQVINSKNSKYSHFIHMILGQLPLRAKLIMIIPDDPILIPRATSRSRPQNRGGFLYVLIEATLSERAL